MNKKIIKEKKNLKLPTFEKNSIVFRRQKLNITMFPPENILIKYNVRKNLIKSPIFMRPIISKIYNLKFSLTALEQK